MCSVRGGAAGPPPGGRDAGRRSAGGGAAPPPRGARRRPTTASRATEPLKTPNHFRLVSNQNWSLLIGTGHAPAAATGHGGAGQAADRGLRHGQSLQVKTSSHNTKSASHSILPSLKLASSTPSGAHRRHLATFCHGQTAAGVEPVSTVHCIVDLALSVRYGARAAMVSGLSF